MIDFKIPTYIQANKLSIGYKYLIDDAEVYMLIKCHSHKKVQQRISFIQVIYS